MSGAQAELDRRLSRRARGRPQPCETAIAWLEAKDFPTLQAAWKVCPYGVWMQWLIQELGLLTVRQSRVLQKAIIRAEKLYDKAMARVWRAWEKAVVKAGRGTDQKALAQADHAQQGMATKLWRVYQKATAQAVRGILPVLPPEERT